MEQVGTNHTIENYVTTNLVIVFGFRISYMHCLNDGSCNRCSQHNKISLEHATNCFVASQEVNSVFLLLSEFETSLSNREISNNDEQKRTEKRKPERNYFEENPAS